MKPIFIAGSILLLSAGCFDPVDNHVEGRVVDELTREAVPNQEIIVHDLIETDHKLVPVRTNLLRTDYAGHFNYTLNPDGRVFYDFYVVGDSLYGFSNYRLSCRDFYLNRNQVTLGVRKLTGLTFIIERKDITNLTDTLYFTWESNGINGKTIYPYKIKNYTETGNCDSMEFRWIGGKIESVIETKVYADKKTIIRWRLFREGQINEINDTIICNRNVDNYTYFKY
ncbi:MAG TPA: hypothetical protein VK179_04030 [Bacteroidales bacterium]|nr:hypothetical protein [Bacteroidales bacterium]